MTHTSKKDQIFSERIAKIKDFQFHQQVAVVFDDMISRSVPLYNEIQKSTVDLLAKFIQPDTYIYDLGCASGTTLLLLAEAITDPSIKIVGIDNSEEMLKTCRYKLHEKGITSVELVNGDITNFAFQKSSAIILNYTLQFIPLAQREQLLKNIYNNLEADGILLLSEKVHHQSPKLGEQFYNLHHNFKSAKGYSALEISQKREALENVLIPLKVEENINLLAKCGFKEIEIFAKWYNWASIVALK